jgi:xanthine dehydrogenase accessory factor
MGRLVQTICSLLEQGEDLVLATIVSHQGSTPRTAGTKMIVRRGGDTIATVGGGLVEGEVMKAADGVFQSRSAQVRSFDLTGENAESMDLVCGGSLEILIEFMEANTMNVGLFRALSESVKTRNRSHLIADLGSQNEPPLKVNRSLIIENGARSGDLLVPPELMEKLGHWNGNRRYPVIFTVNDRRYLVEPSFALGTVYLFGAGHVSQHVAPLAKKVDFRVVVMDDRSEFADRNRFPDADEVSVLPSFEDSFQALDIDDESYVVIVTRGHLHDKTVLRQALRTNARYVGMIGSRRKRDRIYHELAAEGFTTADLARVYAPIGTAIAAETPEEIGISIIGELIKVRANTRQ